VKVPKAAWPETVPATPSPLENPWASKVRTMAMKEEPDVLKDRKVGNGALSPAS
jgi:hypothetical protein